MALIVLNVNNQLFQFKIIIIIIIILYIFLLILLILLFSCFTACGRVYYGLVGKTYERQILWPREGRRPPACNLTFVAAGGAHGELVQISLLKLTLGKFHQNEEKGCPHGHMQIIENQKKYR